MNKGRHLALALLVLCLMTLACLCPFTGGSFLSRATPTPTVDPVVHSRETLQRQFVYWSSTETQDNPAVASKVYFVVTYLSPQLVEAVMNYRVATGEIEESEVKRLVQETEAKLQRESRLPFLMFVWERLWVIKIPSGWSTQIDFARDLQLVDIRGRGYAPLEYDHTFDHAVDLEQNRRALIYFPRRNPDGMDLLSDSSFTLHAQNVHLGPYVQGTWLGDCNLELTWTFNLVPATMALEELDRRVESQVSVALDIDASDVLQLIEIIVTVISLL